MQRAFDLLEHVGDAVEAQAGPQRSKIARHDREGLPPGRRTHQTPSQGVVHHVAERTTGPARFRGQFRGKIVIEGQCRPHPADRNAPDIMMSTRCCTDAGDIDSHEKGQD